MASHAPEKAKRYNQQYRQRQIEKWHAENGDLTPLCECGCGERVGFDHNGKLNRFAGVNHHFRVIDLSGPMQEWHEVRRDRQDAIPIEKFRAAVRKVKADRGFTWQSMADAGGWSRNMLNYYAHDKRVKSIGRKLGEDFFKRIQGIPCEPSTYMKKKAKESMMRENHLIASMDRIYAGK